MATDHSKQPKCCCTECGKEFYVIYFDRHTKVCKHINKKPKKEKVSCPICGKRLKEINTAHLRTHGLDYNQVKKMFPDYDFISEKSLSKKATLSNLTPEQSKRLKYGHTLESRKEKWGEEEGTERHLKAKEAYSTSKTLQGYIDRLGEDEGGKQWQSRTEKISLAAKESWDKVSKSKRSRGTLQWYQERYGEEDGKLKWIQACNNKSKSLRQIPIELVEEYSLYRVLVSRVTKINVKLYGNSLLFLNSRGRNLHLDHMYSVYRGFIDSVSPYIVGFVGNLELLSSTENCSKQLNCSQSLEQLKDKIAENKEYQNIIKSDLFGINNNFQFILNSIKIK